MKTLRLILGDQLNHQHSWYLDGSKECHYVMMEIRQETDYVRHHVQKVIGIFLAMRSFTRMLRDQGFQVHYFTIDDDYNQQSLEKNIGYLIEKYQIEKFEYQLPDEYRLDQSLIKICQSMNIPSQAFDTEHFLTTREELSIFFNGKKTFLMENYYRHLRKKHNVLMKGGQPIQNQWNFDSSNRKSFPKSISFPTRPTRKKSIRTLLKTIDSAGIETIGSVGDEMFWWPVTRKEALQDLTYFCDCLLSDFGKYQDAMHVDNPIGYHSLLSFALNIKLLHPKEVIDRVIEKWKNDRDQIELSSVEGFIRQILGWREYMRGIYWSQMPKYSQTNFFNHFRKLPDWYWTGKTKMRCLSHAIRQSLDHGYAHHIQRLMITGNFGLLSGINPDEMDQWYLGIYIDAFEWVEITNTRGMSQFADGGLVGTKPYVSSANYIHNMSNYCETCSYNYQLKTGKNACPFNSLYWHFHFRHRKKLEQNPRIGMVYRTWDKMNQQSEILNQAEKYLADLNSL